MLASLSATSALQPGLDDRRREKNRFHRPFGKESALSAPVVAEIRLSASRSPLVQSVAGLETVPPGKSLIL